MAWERRVPASGFFGEAQEGTDINELELSDELLALEYFLSLERLRQVQCCSADYWCRCCTGYLTVSLTATYTRCWRSILFAFKPRWTTVAVPGNVNNSGSAGGL